MTPVVAQSQVKGATVSVQMSVQVSAPVGERWIFTFAIGSADVATEAIVAVPRSGEPGLVS